VYIYIYIVLDVLRGHFIKGPKKVLKRVGDGARWPILVLGWAEVTLPLA